MRSKTSIKRGLQERILELKEQGYSYRQIEKLLGCARSTICYHLGEDQKDKTKLRNKKYKIPKRMVERMVA
tara:strand:+ start:1584 stop:1796 length:213 start_codon:yes stop_codon:yes gene_type:complete